MKLLLVLGLLILVICWTAGVKVTVSESNTEGNDEVDKPASDGGARRAAHPGDRSVQGRHGGGGGYVSPTRGCGGRRRYVSKIYLYVRGKRIPCRFRRWLRVRFCKRRTCYSDYNPYYIRPYWGRDRQYDRGNQGHRDGRTSYRRDQTSYRRGQPYSRQHSGSQERHVGAHREWGWWNVRPWRPYPQPYSQGYCHGNIRTAHRLGYFDKYYKRDIEYHYGVRATCDTYAHCHIPLEIDHYSSCSCRAYQNYYYQHK